MKQRISQVRTQLAANHAVSGGTRLIQSELTIMPLVAVGAVVRARVRRGVTFVTFGRPETCLVTVSIVNIRASARGVSRSRHPLAVASATSSLSRGDGEGDRA